jgi:hypothetical protein
MEHGKARLGKAWHGFAWRGTWRGAAGRGSAWFGEAWQGPRRQHWAIRNRPTRGQGMTSGKLFLGGVPTDADVRKMREAFGTPEEGKVIEYSAVEDVLGISRDSNRFRVVTNRWRKLLYRELNIFIGVRPSEGFVALTPSERLDHGRSKVQSGMRVVGRATAVLGSTDRKRLSPKEAEAFDHTIRVSQAVLHAAQIESKRVLGPTSAPTVGDKRD